MGGGGGGEMGGEGGGGVVEELDERRVDLLFKVQLFPVDAAGLILCMGEMGG